MTTKYLIDFLEERENFEPLPYLCPAGYKTVGYGHVIRKDEDFSIGISQEEARTLLMQDIKIAEAAVLRLTRRHLTESQFSALTSFTFNLGVARYQASTLRQCVEMGYEDHVSLQFSRWIYSNGKKLDGLVIRRYFECEMYFNELPESFDRNIFLNLLQKESSRIFIENSMSNNGDGTS
jgi:lysozyme